MQLLEKAVIRFCFIETQAQRRLTILRIAEEEKTEFDRIGNHPRSPSRLATKSSQPIGLLVVQVMPAKEDTLSTTFRVTECEEPRSRTSSVDSEAYRKDEARGDRCEVEPLASGQQEG
jgi:hypothetical protein